MNKILKVNNLIIGILAGIIFAIATYGVIVYIKSSFSVLPFWLSEPKTAYFLALVPDLVLFRIYMVNLKLDKTGKGFLLVAFAGIIAAFFLA